MSDDNGYVTNFINSSNGDKKTGLPSSYKGGAWWSARARWALSKAYRITKKEKYLNLYKNIKITDTYSNDIAGLLLLAELELADLGDQNFIQYLIEKITNGFEIGSFFKHGSNETSTHMWGYHELEAVARFARVTTSDKLLKYCISTIDTMVNDAVQAGYFYSYPEKDREHLCAYCVSPFVRGLYEIYLISPSEKISSLLNNSIGWFYGNNYFNATFYDNKSGRCFDGIYSGKVVSDAGAESAIEAGFCEVRRLLFKHPKELNGYVK